MLLEIREPVLDDLSVMLQIEQAANAYPWSESLLASNFGDRYHNGLLIRDGEAVGFYIADWVAGESTLMNISIDPLWQGQHLGACLMQHYLDQTEQMGCQCWWLEVRLSNEKAQNLYRKLGYSQVGYRKNYYSAGDTREDALVLQRLPDVGSVVICED